MSLSGKTIFISASYVVNGKQFPIICYSSSKTLKRISSEQVLTT